jgi:hypothetical protein
MAVYWVAQLDMNSADLRDDGSAYGKAETLVVLWVSQMVGMKVDWTVAHLADKRACKMVARLVRNSD